MKKINLILGFVLIMFFAMSTNLFATNNALNFDGSNDNVSCGTINLSGSAITLEAWIKPESFKSASPYISNIVGEEADGHSAFLRLGDAHLTDGKKPQFVLYIGSAQTKLDGNTALSAGVWYHVAATYDGSNMRIYINGKEDASQVQAGAFSANTTFYISEGGTRCFDGQIDEVRIWNDVRTEAGIRQNMYQELSDPSSETNLVAYYKLNESDGITTAVDSKDSHNGILTNMTGSEWTTSSAFFGPKNCLDFDGGLKTGSPDYASKSANVTSNTDDFTMMAWIKPDVVTSGTNGWRCVAYNGDDAGGWGIGISGSKVAGLFGAVVYLDTGEILSVGNWYHIAMRRSSGTVQFFLNGKLLSYSNTENAPLSPNQKFTIGNMFSADGSTLYTDSFDGQIDEVRVYDAALTNQQIRENMCKTLTGTETNLVAYYNFDNTSGTTLQSFDGGTGNDLSLTNMNDDDWVSSSAFNTWLNTNSSDWTRSTNWSRGSVPVSTDNVGVYSYSGGTSPVSSSDSPLQYANHMVMDDSSMTLSNFSMVIYGNLILEEDLDLDGQNILLMPAVAYLIEDAGLLCGDSGIITATRNLSNITSENVAGLGAEITTAANMGSTVITRGHSAVSGESGLPKSILRYYQITPTTNTGLNATLKFYYNANEFNGIPEEDLALFRWNGSKWQCNATNQSRYVDNDWVQQTGIDAFSKWTLGDEDDVTLVELVSFTATECESPTRILLEWETASEIDNAGFHLWRSKTADGEYVRITDSIIPAEGSPTLGVEYEYEDFDVESGWTYYYKLEDIDTDGVNTFHTVSLTLAGTAAAPEASADSDSGGGGCFIDSMTHNN